MHRRDLLRGVAMAGLLAAAGAVPAGLATAARAAEEKKDEHVNTAVLHKEPPIGDMALGSPDAPVTIVEYASATCPHCATFHEEVWPQLKKEFVDTGKVRFVFREFPLDQLALAAFMLTRCAGKEKYFPMLDLVMKNQRTWVKNPREELLKIAKLAGMTEQQFDACLKNEKLAMDIVAMSKDANRLFGVDSTPTFFVNGRRVVGGHSIEEFRRIIDEELKKAQQKKG